MTTYRIRKVPAEPNQLHLKTWRYLEAPRGPGDPIWLQRAAEYWHTQAETYGVVYHDDMQVIVNYTEGVVVTAIHVDRVLPGERVRDYVTPRIAAQAAH